MAHVRAVLLAAGRGVRMGGKSAKALVPLPGREPLMHYMLRGLELAGVDDLLVVTGFRNGDVEAFVGDHWPHQSTFVFNARYASWGNFHSLRVALDQSPGATLLVVNSDIVVHPDALTRSLATEGDLILGVQRRLRLEEEDMRVRLDGDRVLAIGKHLKMRLSQGEFAGLSVVRPEAARAYLNVATDLEWQGVTQGYYEDVYAAILDRIDVRASDVNEGEYAEVDEPNDLERAAEVVDRHREAWEREAAPAQA